MAKLGIGCPRGPRMTPVTIDLGLFTSEYPRPFSLNAAQRAQITSLQTALRSHGCVALTNHGAEDFLSDLLTATDELVALPAEEKLRMEKTCQENGGIIPYARRKSRVKLAQKFMELSNQDARHQSPEEAKEAAERHADAVRKFRKDIMPEDIEIFTFPVSTPPDISQTFLANAKKRWGKAAQDGDLEAEDALSYLKYWMVGVTPDAVSFPDPTFAPTARSAILAYQRALQKISAVLMRILEVACHAKPGRLMDVFAPSEMGLTDEHMTAKLRCLHYTYRDDNTEEETPFLQGMAGHTDKGIFTLNYCPDDAWEGSEQGKGDDHSLCGLEVLYEGTWHPVVRRHQHDLLVNLGDLMMWVSNGRWQSTIHRVTQKAPRPRDLPSSLHCWHRRAFPFFVNPSIDVVVAPIMDLQWTHHTQRDDDEVQASNPSSQPIFGAAHFSRWFLEILTIFHEIEPSEKKRGLTLLSRGLAVPGYVGNFPPRGYREPDGTY